MESKFLRAGPWPRRGSAGNQGFGIGFSVLEECDFVVIGSLGCVISSTFGFEHATLQANLSCDTRRH